MTDGVDEFAARMGVSRAHALDVLSKHPETRARVDELTAISDAAMAVAAVEALGSLDQFDIEDFAAAPDPAAALAETVDLRARNHLRAKIAAHESWAQTEDPSARTQPARDAFRAKFEKQVDPDGTLPPDERKRRAESARKAHYARMAYKSAQARRNRSA